MKYDIRHVTTYGYSAPVPFSRCVLRVTPVCTSGQQVIEADIHLDPAPDMIAHETDFFGNRQVRVDFSKPHQRLEIRTTARIDVSRAAPPDRMPSPHWEHVRGEAAATGDLAASSPVHGLFASRVVPLSEAALAYARPSFPTGREIYAGALDLTRRIKADFAYDPEATDVATPLDVALKLKRGVCQDFAHVMIAGLRGLGIPALYVSGYLRTIPPKGQPRLEGADATHAWVDVWCGETLGWIGLDPTNGIAAGESHIVLARGRDYADVPPVEGIVITSSDRWLAVSVDVAPVEIVSP